MAYPSRAKRLDEALQLIGGAKEDALAVVQELKEEIDSWKEGLEGTNLENSQKYEELQECSDALENLESEVEDIEIPDGSDVMFPGMY